MKNLVHDLLAKIGAGKMSSLAYDTAWIARLGNINWALSSHALEWISKHQLEDGSWGVSQPFYYHDRVISTLAAMIALTYQGRRGQDKDKIERGLIALDRITSSATHGLMSDPNGTTVGFEMIVPTLVKEAEKLGIIKQQGERVLGRLAHMRNAKLAKIQGNMINRNMSIAFSAEMLGLDGKHLLDIPNIQESNGSIAHSPSATAYFAIYVQPGDLKALNYLEQIISVEGGASDLAPFDLYERAWVLWNLNLNDDWDADTIEKFKPHLAHLYQAWNPKTGVGFSNGYSVPDGDDTIITYDILHRFGYNVNIETVLSYEEPRNFRCYHLEVGISPSVNIHAMIALYEAGFPIDHPTVQKILRFLESTQKREYWLDKWHSSPYYTTSHFIIACARYNSDLAQKSVEWIINTQRQNGAWGFFCPTAEETAYCLQALSIWQKKKGNVHQEVLQHGLAWLEQSIDAPYYPLWIGKGLYSADWVVCSAILSAIRLTKSVLNQ